MQAGISLVLEIVDKWFSDELLAWLLLSLLPMFDFSSFLKR